MNITQEIEDDLKTGEKQKNKDYLKIGRCPKK